MIETYNTQLEAVKSYLPSHLANEFREDMPLDDLKSIFIHLTLVQYALSTYLPRYLVEAIDAGMELGQISGGFNYGTAMFADVSGFTAMSEKLSTLGKEGAEEVTRIVNNYFDTMLSISDQYDGDLLKFGGDALLLFFAGQDGPQRAVTTALAMQAAMAHFTEVKTSLGTFPLRMSIGVGTGPVFQANLGNEHNMEYTAMGRTLTNMAQAEEQASAGQIMVDQATQEALADEGLFTNIADDFWLVDQFSGIVKPIKEVAIQPEQIPAYLILSDNQPEIWRRALAHIHTLEKLRLFLPDDLLKQLILDPQQDRIPGSHRPVTIMFANFYGIDEIIAALGPAHEAQITTILNDYFVTMSDILTHYAGIINKVDAYAIGHRIMALFGALRVREDDAQRAVRAAIEMNAALAEVNERVKDVLASISHLTAEIENPPLKQRIGLNTGFVFSGNVGSSSRHEHSVMGDEVNLTARLMSVAQEGQVLVSEKIERHVRDIFEMVEQSPVQVKGKTVPVRNFVVTTEKERMPRWANIRTSPIVGRETELLRGQAAVKDVCNGLGRVLTIYGASGIGKTRLAEALVGYGRDQNMNLLAGTCLSYGHTMPYHPWVEVLRTYFGLLPNEDQQVRVDIIQRELDNIGEGAWTPLIGDLLRLEIPDNELTKAIDGQIRQQRVLDLILKLMRTLAQARPLMLVLEDVHWADKVSRDLITYLARNIHDAPILLILLYRPDEAFDDWKKYEHTVDIPIFELSREKAIQVVQGLLNQSDLSNVIYDLILSKGGGNPFFIEEVVRVLVDTEALKQDETGRWQSTTSADPIELPDTVHGIIISRIDRLLETDRRLLQVASVVGTNFSSQIIGGVYPYGDVRGDINQHLDYLDSLGLTEDEPTKVDLHRFKHLTTREVVYETLAFNQRRGLHRRIANFIETETENVDEQVDLLAYHYFDGQDWKKALYYNLIAARHAQREFANDTAVAAYKRALLAARSLDQYTKSEELLAQEALGEVLTLLGRYDDALTHYAEARALVEAEDDPAVCQRHLADLCRKTADVYEKRSEYETAFEWLEKGLSYLDEVEPTIEAARIYLLGGGVYHRQGKNDEAIEWCEKSLAIANQLDTPESQRTKAQTYYNLGSIYIRRGDLNNAIRVCHQSAEVYQRIDDLLGLSHAYNNLGVAYSDQGNWIQAVESFQKSLAIKRKIGEIHSQGYITNNLANIYLYRGEWQQAIDLLEESNTIWKQIGAILPEAVIKSNLAQVYIYQKDWVQAGDCLRQSQTIFSEIASDDFLPELERRWGEYYLNTNDISTALFHIYRSIDLATNQEARLEEGMSYRILGLIHLAKDEVDLAKKTLLKSWKILTELDSEYEAAKTQLALAQVLVKGQAREGQDHLQSAIKTFKKLGAQADLIEAEAMKASDHQWSSNR